MSVPKTATIEAHTRVMSTDPDRLGKFDHLISYLTSEGRRGRIRIKKDMITDEDIRDAIQRDIAAFKSAIGKKFTYQ